MLAAVLPATTVTTGASLIAGTVSSNNDRRREQHRAQQSFGQRQSARRNRCNAQQRQFKGRNEYWRRFDHYELESIILAAF